MPDRIIQPSHGEVFDELAAEYDRHRPGYPDRLIDRACELAALNPGDRVLEIGCGTGQLTRGLLARHLSVTAIEPGAHLAELARQRLRGVGELEIVEARFEDANLPRPRFQAVLSASAIHWVDPDVSWRRAADALVSGGTLALIQYVGLREPRSAEDQETLLGRMSAIAPEIAAEWPRYRDLETTLEGAHARRKNVSEVWAWLGDCQIARDYAAYLFDDVEIVAVPTPMEHTADELNALLGTLSFCSRISPRQRKALEEANRALYERLGRPVRSSVLACLVTARRV